MDISKPFLLYCQNPNRLRVGSISNREGAGAPNLLFCTDVTVRRHTPPAAAPLAPTGSDVLLGGKYKRLVVTRQLSQEAVTDFQDIRIPGEQWSSITRSGK